MYTVHVITNTRKQACTKQEIRPWLFLSKQVDICLKMNSINNR